MKTKIYYFILMGAFIVSALHYSNDRDDLINIHSQSVNFNSEINTKIVGLFRSRYYTKEEMEKKIKEDREKAHRNLLRSRTSWLYININLIYHSLMS